MSSLTIELPTQQSQTRFNLARWAEVLADPNLNKVEGRVETDRHGYIIMSPPPAANHGFFQGEVYFVLRSLMPNGRVSTECPISTADGVRAADVAWASPECLEKLGGRVCFPISPEICVEVVSPSNSDMEIEQKMALYFDAGAQEVWLCSDKGKIQFFEGTGQEMPSSRLCPQFPNVVKLAGP